MRLSSLFLLLLISFFFPSFESVNRRDFSVEVTFVDWLNQPFVRYQLNTKRILVETSDYEDFKVIKQVLYRRQITKEASDSIYTFLSSLKPDTAKANCRFAGLDGLSTTYTYKGYAIEPQVIKTYACITESAAELRALVEDQIKDEPYKYWNLKFGD